MTSTPTRAATFQCIDAHTCGNPVRVVMHGAPTLEGKTMSEKRKHFVREYDWIRKGLMFEPRGHDVMSGSIIYPPSDPAHDAAVLFIETSGCLPMCGHGTIGTVTVAIEEGRIIPKTPGKLILEVPAGVLQVDYHQEGPKVKTVKIHNVPSFLDREKITLMSPLGELIIDVSFGGNFYAIVDQQKNFPGFEHFEVEQLILWSRQLRKTINEKYNFVHPLDSTIRSCSHILWTGSPKHQNSSTANAVFYGDKAIDRSPCGTGTSARMAQWFARGKLRPNQAFIHESIIGTQFTGHIEKITEIAKKPAIIPSITGWARVYGRNTISIDPQDDPFAYGFQVR